MNNAKYIAVTLDTAWELKEESQGWIFRQMDNPTYGFSGHYRTAGDAIRDILNNHATVVQCNGVMRPTTVLNHTLALNIP